MFSHEERVKAIQLFLKYDCSYAATIRELGYPSVGALRKWYKEYFVNQTEVFKWFEVISGQSVESITEILAIAEQRKDENDNSFCNIYEYAAG